jgi:hypothetical protein
VIRILAVYHKEENLEDSWKGAGGHPMDGYLHLFCTPGAERILQ